MTTCTVWDCTACVSVRGGSSSSTRCSAAARLPLAVSVRGYHRSTGDASCKNTPHSAAGVSARGSELLRRRPREDRHSSVVVSSVLGALYPKPHWQLLQIDVDDAEQHIFKDDIVVPNFEVESVGPAGLLQRTPRRRAANIITTHWGVSSAAAVEEASRHS